jgi:C4-dicarboxylate transporter, DctM subunit
LRTKGSINDVIIGTSPFVLALFAMLGVLTLFPQLALWLPKVIN